MITNLSGKADQLQFRCSNRHWVNPCPSAEKKNKNQIFAEREGCTTRFASTVYLRVMFHFVGVQVSQRPSSRQHMPQRHVRVDITPSMRSSACAGSSLGLRDVQLHRSGSRMLDDAAAKQAVPQGILQAKLVSLSPAERYQSENRSRRVSDTSRGLSARGAGAFAAEVKPTIVVESQREVQATINE